MQAGSVDGASSVYSELATLKLTKRQANFAEDMSALSNGAVSGMMLGIADNILASKDGAYSAPVASSVDSSGDITTVLLTGAFDVGLLLSAAASFHLEQRKRMLFIKYYEQLSVLSKSPDPAVKKEADNLITRQNSSSASFDRRASVVLWCVAGLSCALYFSGIALSSPLALAAANLLGMVGALGFLFLIAKKGGELVARSAATRSDGSGPTEEALRPASEAGAGHRAMVPAVA